MFGFPTNLLLTKPKLENMVDSSSIHYCDNSCLDKPRLFVCVVYTEVLPISFSLFYRHVIMTRILNVLFSPTSMFYVVRESRVDRLSFIIHSIIPFHSSRNLVLPRTICCSSWTLHSANRKPYRKRISA